MGLTKNIKKLVHYGIGAKLIQPEDEIFMINQYLDLFGLDEYDNPDIFGEKMVLADILNELTDIAFEKGIIQSDDIVTRDLFDTKLMGIMTPRPGTVKKIFDAYYEKNPKYATDYFYELSQNSNYIRKDRIQKDMKWTVDSPYGVIDITINLSKPEKDPKAIAAAKNAKQSAYPKCQLCIENEGYAGRMNHPARQNHRIIPITIHGSRWGFQYSPYVYYNEHCIVFNEEHKPMVINENTFKNLFSFLDIFPHYMIGSNADLPIVGGSILSHDHYQGGNYEFPIQGAEVLKTLISDKYPSTLIEVVKWPLSTVRLTSENKEELVALSVKMLDYWRHYNAPVLDIISHTEDIPHNTITPIARRKGDKYQIDLVLRNNRTSTKYPDGIFHPHQESHHIKKENIGLIEVMGLAILPARLKDELKLLSDCLLKKAKIEEYPELDKHHSWYQQLLAQHEFTETNIDEILKEAVAIKFVNVLEDAGVFKMDDYGIDALTSFVETVLKGE